MATVRSRVAYSLPGRLFAGSVLMILVLFWPDATDLQGADASGAGQVNFNLQIRPLLSDRCFSCHGPDEKSRKARLRLDQPESAYAVRDPETRSRAISPGRPEESEVYLRISATDPDEIMPPSGSGLALSSAEKELIRRWIEQGAAYAVHWSLVPVRPPTVPQSRGEASNRNPIDAFVAARLQKENLALAPEASRETLIRRLSFDLTGLPPTLAEIDAFLADTAPGAYQRVVDRLLASPRYGEMRAGEWLDLARYADTYGYQNDVPFDASPWRDWVIKAFNQNLPYDEFIVWQVAGDLLEDPTSEQVLATAFNRLHRQTNEGGSIDEEFRTEYAADRVHTAGTVFLGLTFECARCHDHKFDPIRQKDYYRMFAFFNNIDESGLYSHFTMATPSPSLLLYPDGVETQHQALKQKIASAEERLRSLSAKEQARFREWLGSGNVAVAPPQPVASYSFEAVSDNKTANNIGTNSALLVDGPTQIVGRQGQALRFSGDNALVCKGAGAFHRTDAFSFSLWIRPAERQERAVVFHRSRAWSDSGSRGYELVLEQGRPAFGLVHFWPGNAVQVRAREPLSADRWTHLAVTYDGSSQARGVRLYVDGTLATVEVVRDHLFKDIVHRIEWGDSDVGHVELTLAGRFRDSGLRNGALDEFQVFDRCLTPLEVRELSATEQSSDREGELFEQYLAQLQGPYLEAKGELHRLRVAENALVNDVREIMVMREMPQRRPTFLLKRGAYNAPGEAVEPGTPESILPFPEELPRDRLGLARWLVDRRNPLTARVAVNRVWRTHFGRGLVATAEDFGSQGQLPTHPELLDWLAWTFMESGWDVKALHRLVVMSATYRQTSITSPALLARDPENQWLGRGPKHRLQAEQIRDHALAVSGLLTATIGGPSVRPYQPPGLWEESGTGKTYVQDKGDKLYRRSLYTFWKRTAPPPNMLSFDATTREVCTARRETTATPLQSLILLNDPQFLEAARVLAERLVRESTRDLDARIVSAFRSATGRPPDGRECAVLRQLYAEQLARFEREPAAAEAFLKVGQHPRDETLWAPDVAATTLLASAVMNLDEFVMKR